MLHSNGCKLVCPFMALALSLLITSTTVSEEEVHRCYTLMDANLSARLWLWR